MPSGAARAANATVLRGRASLLRPLLTESSRTETTNGSHGRGGYGAARAWMLPRRLVRGRQGRARRGTAQAGGGAIGPVPEPVYSFLVFALRRCTGRTWVPMTKQEEYVEDAVESA